MRPIEALLDNKRINEAQQASNWLSSAISDDLVFEVAFNQHEDLWRTSLTDLRTALAVISGRLRNEETVGETDRTSSGRLIAEIEDQFNHWLQARRRELPTQKLEQLDPKPVKLGDQEAYLWSFVGRSALHLILRTTNGVLHQSFRATKEDITSAVQAYAEVLRNPFHQYHDLGRRLSRFILDPIAAHLRGKNLRHVLVWWDHPLRSVPFTALIYDDGQFVAQTISSTLLTKPIDAETPPIAANIAPDRRIVGFGASTSAFIRNRSLPSLPGVREELDAIVQISATDKGLRKGNVFLNDAFTAASLVDAWVGDAGILHFATHFVLEPDGRQSYLLLGGSKTLSLAELDGKLPSTSSKDLVVFSACDTSVFGSDPDGIPVDSLAVWAIARGARNVVATHWQVNDILTAEVMQRFHASLVQGRAIADAIQQSQLALLDPQVTTAQFGNNRGAILVDAYGHADSKHPYYWAAFSHFR